MNETLSKLLMGAMVTGLVAGTTIAKADQAAGGEEGTATESKGRCSGRCNGKCKGYNKNKKREIKGQYDGKKKKGAETKGGQGSEDAK